MSLKDPVAIYNGADNLEVPAIYDLLKDAGINAFVAEDIEQIGTWVAGFVPEINKPQVWIEREDIERARPILENYERQYLARIAANEAAAKTAEPIEMTCEECGKVAPFTRDQIGTVQICPTCGAYIDVTLDPRGEEGRVATEEP